MYQNQYYPQGPYKDERFVGGFVVPFLFGSLAGGAAVGLSRPRPVYVNPGYPRPYYNPYGPYYY